MEGDSVQRGAKGGGEDEGGNCRWGSGEKRGKGCGSNTIGETSAVTATPRKDDGRAKTEQRRRHNEERADVDIEEGHAPSHTANIRGDSNVRRGIKYVLRRGDSHRQAE
jgi:hypothetical protein